MSQIENVATSAPQVKRTYRKGKPLSASEKQLAAVARKRVTHKEVKAYVRSDLKVSFLAICEDEGVTQGQMLERLIEGEIARRENKR